MWKTDWLRWVTYKCCFQWVHGTGIALWTIRFVNCWTVFGLSWFDASNTLMVISRQILFWLCCLIQNFKGNCVANDEQLDFWTVELFLEFRGLMDPWHIHGTCEEIVSCSRKENSDLTINVKCPLISGYFRSIWLASHGKRIVGFDIMIHNYE
jgi:hypothetical protein